MKGSIAVAAAGAAVHLLCRVAFVAEGRFFASEDDPYRAYTAYLIQGDPIRLIGRLWVVGFEACHALLQSFGVPTRWAGIAVNTFVFAALLVGVIRIMGRLAPGRDSLKWAAVALVFASPMTVTLAHSSLSDLLATCLIVWAAEGVLQYLEDQKLGTLGRAAVTLAFASWVRYEPWLHAALLLPVAGFVEWRVSRRRRVSALLVAALAWLGPIAWMIAQQLRYGDPLYFYENIVETVETLSGPPARMRVLSTLMESAFLWFPHIVVLAALGWHRRRDALSVGRAWFFTGALLLGAVFHVLGGHQHATFPARFSYGVEVALLPWAALGLDWCFEKRSRSAVAAAVVLFSLSALRPAALLDRDSVAFGNTLRRSELIVPPGTKLLIERPLKRPPFGWASVGVLWGHWDQTVWVTPQPGGWTVVHATDVRAPQNLSHAELSVWLEGSRASAAFAQSERLRGELARAWPCAESTAFGAHDLLSKRSCASERP